MQKIDDMALSRYLDGDLDFDEVEEIASVVRKDQETRGILLEMLRYQMGMRAIDREVQEEAAEKLQPLVRTVSGSSLSSKTTDSTSGGRLKRWPRQPLLQMAAAMVLVFIGFFYGKNIRTGTYSPFEGSFPAIPLELSTAVNQLLEYQPSGTVRQWQDQKGKLSASLSPVKSYRGPHGEIYRIYFVDIEYQGRKRKLAGLAARKGHEQWVTRSLFTRQEVEKM